MTQTTERMLPLYEAKMLAAYDHRNADVVKSETAQHRQNQPRYLSDREHEDPLREPLPQAWVREELIPSHLAPWLTGFSDVTSATNERTILSAALPRVGVGHTYPLYFGDRPHLLLAQWNSLVVDYLARQKVAGLHLTYTYLRQLPLLPPTVFEAACPWDRHTSLEVWITKRVVRLSCTSEAMRPMAIELLGIDATFEWQPTQRSVCIGELDAAMFILFEVSPGDVDYIMDTFTTMKRKDIAAFGSYRTKELILQVFDAMQAAVDTGQPYVSPNNDLPGAVAGAVNENR